MEWLVCFSLFVFAITFVLLSWGLRRLYRRVTGHEADYRDPDLRSSGYESD